jgi:hypothetical protein
MGPRSVLRSPVLCSCAGRLVWWPGLGSIVWFWLWRRIWLVPARLWRTFLSLVPRKRVLLPKYQHPQYAHHKHYEHNQQFLQPRTFRAFRTSVPLCKPACARRSNGGLAACYLRSIANRKEQRSGLGQRCGTRTASRQSAFDANPHQSVGRQRRQASCRASDTSDVASSGLVSIVTDRPNAIGLSQQPSGSPRRKHDDRETISLNATSLGPEAAAKSREPQ